MWLVPGAGCREIPDAHNLEQGNPPMNKPEKSK
jgi:hypothetical protein